MFCRFVSLLVLAGLAGGAARAQFSGAVEGFVRDSTGGVIPGADVTITDENLGLEREIPSNETGFFRVGELPAGSYSVSVASSGFVSWSTTGLLVRSDETRTLYPEMQIGEVTTSITVEAETSAVNTTEVDNTNYILIPYYVHPSRAPEGVGLWIFGGWREAGRQGGEALGTRCTGSQWYRSQPGPPGSPRMVPGECRRPVPRAAGLSNARWIGLAAAAAVRRRSTAGSDAATAASWPPPSAACAAAPPARSGD